jgi:hypothetical protein
MDTAALETRVFSPMANMNLGILMLLKLQNVSSSFRLGIASLDLSASFYIEGMLDLGWERIKGFRFFLGLVKNRLWQGFK